MVAVPVRRKVYRLRQLNVVALPDIHGRIGRLAAVDEKVHRLRDIPPGHTVRKRDRGRIRFRRVEG